MTTKEKEFATSQEKVAPGVFHIHIDTNDALGLPNQNAQAFHDWARSELGFIKHDFTGHPAMRDHFEPTLHSSVKLTTRQDYDALWQKIEGRAKGSTGIAGYLEGEYIPTDDLIPFKELVEFKKPKFKIAYRPLEIGRGEEFRQTELHLCLDNGNSDQRIIESLLDAGLYGALLKKQDYEMMVLTMQGYSHIIRPLMTEIKRYLNEIGGVVRCTLKEERALNYLLIGIKQCHLPPIADSLTLFS